MLTAAVVEVREPKLIAVPFETVKQARRVDTLGEKDEVDGTGRFWRFPPVTVYPRPVQSPHPPLWVAGNAPAAIDRAARLGTDWLCDPVQTIDKVAELHTQYRLACAAAGTTPSTVLRRYVWLGRDRATMERDFLPNFVNKQLAYWRVSTEGEAERRLFARIDASEDVPPTEVARGRFFGGSPDDVIDDIVAVGAGQHQIEKNRVVLARTNGGDRFLIQAPTQVRVITPFME